jgi:thiamine-phosphate pyrophosphorylase
VRAKEAPARVLFERVRALLAPGVKVIVNTRADIAIAAGAAGVHLPGGSVAPSVLRAWTGPEFLIGVSCHSVAEVERAAAEGASYVFLSPIFDSPSKPGYGPALGLAPLAEACRRVRIPVLALGGVDEQRAAACVTAGAAGYAAISAFAQGVKLVSS